MVNWEKIGGVRIRKFYYLFILVFSFTAPPKTVSAQTPPQVEPSITIYFDAFVSWNYSHKNKLLGSRNTALVIEATLKQWYPSATRSEMIENPHLKHWRGFAQLLSEQHAYKRSIVYISGHQSAAGELEFTNREKSGWKNLLHQATPQANPQRITILDVCYADSANITSSFTHDLGPVVVFSSKAGEKTYELELGNKRPVDYERRYPVEMAWLKKELGSTWDKKLTFFGLVWTRAALALTKPPETDQEWAHFFSQVQSAATDFRKERSEKLASEIVIHRHTLN